MQQIQIPFTDAVKRALTVNYCNFEGRSSRSEYWWFCLFNIILSVIISFVFSFSQNAELIVSGIVSLALLLPGLGVAIRRLHDIDKSGWWILIGLIPLVGTIILIVWFCKESTPAENQYGPVPNVI